VICIYVITVGIGKDIRECFVCKWGKSQDKGLRGFLSPCMNGVARDFLSPCSSGVGRYFSRPCSSSVGRDFSRPCSSGLGWDLSSPRSIDVIGISQVPVAS
jgi:hypothetical protein